MANPSVSAKEHYSRKSSVFLMYKTKTIRTREGIEREEKAPVELQ